jgi:hypothetical protein
MCGTGPQNQNYITFCLSSKLALFGGHVWARSCADITCFTVLRGSSFETNEENCDSIEICVRIGALLGSAEFCSVLRA